MWDDFIFIEFLKFLAVNEELFSQVAMIVAFFENT